MLRFLSFRTCLISVCICAAAPSISQTREEVFEAQRALTYLGYELGGVDGQWGRNSERALTEFLIESGAEYDGKLDQNELSLLSAAVMEAISGNATSYTLSKETGASPYRIPLMPVPANRYFQDVFRTLIDVDGDGIQELFMTTALYDLREPANVAEPGYYSFFRLNERGKWKYMDVLVGNTDDICIHARKAVVADFNGDEVLDVFIACQGWDGMPYSGERNNVLLSQPDGTYKISIPSSDVGFFHTAAAADFNNDGHTDVLVVAGTQQNPAYILLNDGTGTFEKSTRYVPTQTRGSHSWFTVELPDINGDGFFDIFIGGHEWERGPSQVFLNPGDNDFSRSKPITLPEVDGMGVVLDVVVTDDDTRNIWVLRTSGGDGTFYEGVAIQKIIWPDLISEVAYEQRETRWIPSILAWEQDGVGYVGSDNLSSPVPAIER